VGARGYSEGGSMMQTFEQSADIYIEKLKTRRKKPVKETSLASFRSAIKLAETMPGFGSLPLTEIDSEHLRCLVDHLEDKSPHTINITVRVVKAVISSAVDDRGNPMVSRTWNPRHINAPAATNKEEKTLLTAAQIEAAIKNADGVMKIWIATQAASGLRKGEMLALDVNDFSAEAGTLMVNATDGYYGKTAPKTRSANRVVDLHPSIVGLLVRHVGTRSTGKLLNVTVDEARRAFERLGIHSHDLRHFRYTHLQLNAVPQAILNFWIGHTMTGMAGIYGHLAEITEKRREIANSIGVGFDLEGL
jgi:integrase